ncbi:MAG: DUF4282 domain-containing protein [Hyphomonadaceae bacterium]|nr:DUF4282 domain-containing protein [Hyphomonadaceae bacterium]
MQSILQRFLGFERLLGPVLVKIVYYVGAAGIVLVASIGLITGLLALFGGNLGQALMQIVAVPVVAGVGLVYWRFICELFMLAFLAYERLGQVRDAILGATGAPAPDPNYPKF